MSRDVAKVDFLIRFVLGKTSNAKLTYYREAIKDPKQAVLNPQYRGYAAEVLNSLLDFVFSDPITWNRIRTIKENEVSDEVIEENGQQIIEMSLDNYYIYAAKHGLPLIEQKDFMEKFSSGVVSVMVAGRKLIKEDGVVIQAIRVMNPDREVNEDIGGAVDPLKAKMNAQRQQIQKQKDQVRMQLAQSKAKKEIQDLKTKGQQQLAKEDEELDEAGKVYDPITKKMVPRKPIKVKMGGGTKEVKEAAIADDNFGRANYWYRQHTNRYQALVKRGDLAQAEVHRKKAAEYKRRSYGALDNPDKQLKIQ
jgi:hypothetical protein